MKNNLTLHMMVGNIGTGKTITTRRLIKKFNADGIKTLVINVDSLVCMFSGLNDYSTDLFTEQHRALYGDILVALANQILEHGFNVIVDTTMMSKIKRARFIEVAKKWGAKIIIYLHKTPGGLERRCKENREQSNELWQHVYDMFEKEYEEPSFDEGIDEIIDCTWDSIKC